MKERPILFSGPMVRALLEGWKTATRRICKLKDVSGADFSTYSKDAMGALLRGCPYGQPGDRLWVRENWIYRGAAAHFGGGKEARAEVFIGYPADGSERTIPRPVKDDSGIRFQRAQRETESRQHYDEYLTRSFKIHRPSIHMPRFACRLSLEITEVKVERLQDISEMDAMAEGVVECPIPADDEGPMRVGYMVGPDDGKSGLDVSPCDSFRDLWDSINGEKAPWKSNPWVWAVSFRRLP